MRKSRFCKLIIAFEKSNVPLHNLIRHLLDFCIGSPKLYFYNIMGNVWNHSLKFMANEMHILFLLLFFFQWFYRSPFSRCFSFRKFLRCAVENERESEKKNGAIIAIWKESLILHCYKFVSLLPVCTFRFIF